MCPILVHVKLIKQHQIFRNIITSYPQETIMTTAIVVKDLTKKFNDLVAVNQISFEIQQGEIFGLLGPNGAGKTTTLSMLATMQKPTSGYAKVQGKDIEKDEDGVVDVGTHVTHGSCQSLDLLFDLGDRFRDVSSDLVECIPEGNKLTFLL